MHGGFRDLMLALSMHWTKIKIGVSRWIHAQCSRWIHAQPHFKQAHCWVQCLYVQRSVKKVQCMYIMQHTPMGVCVWGNPPMGFQCRSHPKKPVGPHWNTHDHEALVSQRWSQSTNSFPEVSNTFLEPCNRTQRLWSRIATMEKLLVAFCRTRLPCQLCHSRVEAGAIHREPCCPSTCTFSEGEQ